MTMLEEGRDLLLIMPRLIAHIKMNAALSAEADCGARRPVFDPL
jgi:hypothetical protein